MMAINVKRINEDYVIIESAFDGVVKSAILRSNSNPIPVSGWATLAGETVTQSYTSPQLPEDVHQAWQHWMQRP